jgi:hypothetical protein
VLLLIVLVLNALVDRVSRAGGRGTVSNGRLSL